MNEWQTRVVMEHAELHERLRKLVAFINTEQFRALHEDEQDRMRRQSGIMDQYVSVLQERIDNFNL